MTSDLIPPTLIAATETDEPMRMPSASHGSGGSPGRAIRAARERARLSLEELAKQTKLSRNTLDSLERDDFDALNEAVYVRGYYRKCAKVLVLDEADLLAGYEKMVVPKVPQAPTKLLIGSGPVMGRPSLRRRGNGLRVAVVVIVAASISALLWFLVNQPGLLGSLRGVKAPAAPPADAVSSTTESRPAAQLTAAPPETAPAVSTEVPVAVPPASATGTSTDSTATGAVSPAPGAQSSAAQPSAAAPLPASPPTAVTPATTAPATAAAANGPGGLVLQFNSTSWVRVEDADGRVLLSGVIQAGDRQQLRGRTPYSLFVGNAPGVRVEYDGKPVDITTFVKQNSTARFTVPQ